MNRPRISPSLLEWVLYRRRQGEAWKIIERALRDAGLPAAAKSYWRAANREHARAKSAEYVRRHRASKPYRKAGGATA